MATEIKKVILADDHTLVRKALRALIEDMEGFSVIGEASNGEEAVELVSTLEPDLLVTDIQMPKLNGIQAIEKAKAMQPNLAIVVLSMVNHRQSILDAIQAGALGYVVKESVEEELKSALVAARDGRRYLSHEVLCFVLNDIEGQEVDDDSKDSSTSALTPRQCEVMRRLALGFSIKEISYQLKVSNKTVESHRTQILEKLDLRNTTDIIRYSLSHKVISMDEFLSPMKEH